MTTARKSEANRRNARLSTGPRTAGGKARAGANAVKHGAFSNLPVVPGESAAEWGEHRAGILDSLAPVGALERRLAERAALLLWRLGRVERFETAGLAAGLRAATAPGGETGKGARSVLAGALKGKDESEAALSRSREYLARLESAVEFLHDASRADGAPVPPGVAHCVLESAYNVLPEGTACPAFDGRQFRSRIGAAGQEFNGVAWTAGLVRRGLALVAEHAGVTPDALAARAAREAERERDDRRSLVDRLAAALRGEHRRERAEADQRRASAVLLDDAGLAKVERYEGHLSRQLYQALHELERLQARRAGRKIPLPRAVDVGVSVGAAPSGE